MNLPKNTFVVDIEADDLIEKATKIHVLGYHRIGTKEVKTLTDYNEIRRFFRQPDLCIIGHNFFLYDSIVLDKLLGVGFDYKIIDTLAMSWYLYPRELKHGLEAWGDNPKIGIKKVKIDDWVNGDIESYIERVTQDVKINANLFYLLWRDLLNLYSDAAAANNVLDLLNSILDLYREQYFNPFVLDVELTEKNLAELLSLKEQKESMLRKLMPPVPIKTKKTLPKVLYKKDGSLSENGLRWFQLLDELGASRDVEMVEYTSGYEEPNPSSTEQVKEWLYQNGWQPETYKESISVSGAVTQVPQIKDKEGSLCKSVLKLIDKYPDIKELSDLSIINHRIGILKGFLRDKSVEGTLHGEIAGLTNTLRSRHKRVVNLPKFGVPLGSYIRPCLTVNLELGEVLLGSDISSLENYTRTNLICDIDPSSITELLDSNFDTHLDLCVFSGRMSQEESDFYKDTKSRMKKEEVTEADKKEFARLDKIRHQFKTVNYSALYGVGKAKLSRELSTSLKEAEFLLNAYWNKNYAVKVRSEAAPVKEYSGLKWIYNDIVGVWFELRSEKDRFSSLNQGMGSIIFYSWVREVRSRGVKITLNMHDELQMRVHKDKIDEVKSILQESMDKVNEKFKLTVSIKIDIVTGKNYGETH